MGKCSENIFFLCTSILPAIIDTLLIIHRAKLYLSLSPNEHFTFVVSQNPQIYVSEVLTVRLPSDCDPLKL